MWQAFMNAFGRNARAIQKILARLDVIESVPLRGEPGPRGHKGDVGRMGERGESFDQIQLIKLPLHLVTMGSVYGTTNTRRVMGLVKAFYANLDIDVQDSHSSRHPGALLTYEDDSLAEWHLDNVHGPRLTLYVDPMATWIGPAGNNWLGQVGSFNSVANGTAIIAGAHMDDKVAATIGHELGHMLLTGENADHEPDTFISKNIGDSLIVTDAQRELLRAGAYRLGGY